MRGNYDDVNRLCTQIADKYSWGFANINLRAYYAEGAKTTGFEIAEQLGWRFPKHVVSPVAGGTLLPRILKGFDELRRVGLVEGDLPVIHAAQAAGCAPVVRALEAGLEFPDPVKPHTMAKSIAIGNPADGFQVLRAVRSTGGSGAMVEEDEIVDGITLLAETEGIFTEAAGGVTVAATRKLIERGALPRDQSIVICVTGNGYKTVEILSSIVKPIHIGRSLTEFEAVLGRHTREVGVSHGHAAVQRRVPVRRRVPRRSFDLAADLPLPHLRRPAAGQPRHGGAAGEESGRVDAALRRSLQAHELAVRLRRVGQEGMDLSRSSRRKRRLDGRRRHEHAVGRSIRPRARRRAISG